MALLERLPREKNGDGSIRQEEAIVPYEPKATSVAMPNLNTPPTLTASKGTVDDNQLARSQLGFMQDENGTFWQRNARKGEEYANGRNLLNSSIAAGASVGAAIDAAVPIAINDANTYSRQALANQDADNNMAIESARIHQSNLESMRNNETSRLNQLSQNETSLNAQKLSDASRERTEALRVAADIDMNSNSAKTQSFNQMLANIANIEGSPDLTDEQKNAAIERQIAYQQSFINYQDALQVNSTQKTVQNVINNTQQQVQQTEQAGAAKNQQTIEDKNMQIYNTAKTGGMNAAQVAAAMKIPVEQVNGWLTSKGLSL